MTKVTKENSASEIPSQMHLIWVGGKIRDTELKILKRVSDCGKTIGSNEEGLEINLWVDDVKEFRRSYKNVWNKMNWGGINTNIEPSSIESRLRIRSIEELDGRLFAENNEQDAKESLPDQQSKKSNLKPWTAITNFFEKGDYSYPKYRKEISQNLLAKAKILKGEGRNKAVSAADIIRGLVLDQVGGVYCDFRVAESFVKYEKDKQESKLPNNSEQKDSSESSKANPYSYVPRFQREAAMKPNLNPDAVRVHDNHNPSSQEDKSFAVKFKSMPVDIKHNFLIPEKIGHFSANYAVARPNTKETYQMISRLYNRIVATHDTKAYPSRILNFFKKASMMRKLGEKAVKIEDKGEFPAFLTEKKRNGLTLDEQTRLPNIMDDENKYQYSTSKLGKEKVSEDSIGVSALYATTGKVFFDVHRDHKTLASKKKYKELSDVTYPPIQKEAESVTLELFGTKGTTAKTVGNWKKNNPSTRSQDDFGVPYSYNKKPEDDFVASHPYTKKDCPDDFYEQVIDYAQKSCELKEMVDRVKNNNEFYADDELNFIIESHLPVNTSYISPAVARIPEQLNESIINFKNDQTQNQAIIAVASYNHFTAIHIRKDDGGRFSITYFDPIISSDSRSPIHDLLPHIANSLNENFPTSEIVNASSMIQTYSKSEIDGAIEIDNNHCGAFVSCFLTEMANGNARLNPDRSGRIQINFTTRSDLNIHDMGITQSEEDWRNLEDLSQEQSSELGARLRNYHSKFMLSNKFEETENQTDLLKNFLSGLASKDLGRPSPTIYKSSLSKSVCKTSSESKGG